jgi:chemotaxis protein MotA
MFALIGMGIVTAAIIGGYLMEHGNLSVLFQPAELVIIFGAATGGFLVATPIKTVKFVISSVMRMLTHSSFAKQDYMDVLMLLNGVFYKIRQQGLVSVETDVDEPEQSPLFQNYPKVLKNHRAIDLITDTIRTVMTTTIAPHELEALIDSELEAHHEELLTPSSAVNFVADCLPGLGIVAAVLGVILTMGKISEPPEVLGHSIGAALVGTFLGVLACYGFVGPVGKNLEHMAAEDLQFLTVIKMALLSFIGGAAPKVAVEFGRRVIPAEAKPAFMELEQALRTTKS